MSEAFSKLGDSIYFQDDAGLYVNLFIAWQLDWQERGVRLVQETRFAEDDRLTLTIRTQRPTAFALRLGVPWGGTGANTATLDGRPLDGFAAPGGYYVLNRTWKDGDQLVVRFPMALHTEPTPDDPSLQAVMYGPLVLAGQLRPARLTPPRPRAGPTPTRHTPAYKSVPAALAALRPPAAHPANRVPAESAPPSR